MANELITDTISAAATPLGNGGVSIIRLSGDAAFDILEKIYSGQKITPGKICHGSIIKSGKKIDEVIILPFKSPNSYTGEDVIEIHCHGGVCITNTILDLTIKNGSRLAEKGEFTKRAFLNGKMDLSQAEAVIDLIEARSEKFAVSSAQNVFGKLSAEIKKIKSEITDILAQIIAAADFPEDVKEPEYPYIEKILKKIIEQINHILSFAESSNIFRQGIKIVLAGRPNAGKSSLFNALLNLERAIVTNIAGTTRDCLRETLDMDGIAVTIIDTAGIRDDDSINEAEEAGINFSKRTIQEADIVLFLYDLSKGFTNDDRKILDLIKNKTIIKIGTKSDLTLKRDNNAVCISLKTGENLDILKQKIKSAVLSENLNETEFITNKRQQKSLEKTKNMLINALSSVQHHEIQDLISIDIKSALMFISEVSGEVITDDILNNIFDNFCIGK